MSNPSYHHQVCELARTHYLPMARRICSCPESAELVCEDNRSWGDFQCPELVLQVLWNDQQFAGPLMLQDGRRLEVLSAGTWNVEPGPDFRGALLSIDGKRVRGDVEIHHRAGDWHRHGHDQDRGYDKVILHAVYEEPRSGEEDGLPPSFVMSSSISGSLRPLVEEIAAQSYPYARRVAPGGCALRVAQADCDQLQRWLRAAGLSRFWIKSRRLRQDIEHRGSGQVLYEHFFESLGYKANRTPFRRLAEAVTLSDLGALRSDGERRAVLFASAGLLVDPTRFSLPEEAALVLKGIWDDAWRNGCEPMELSWDRTRTRPCNQPERRLYAGCLVLEQAGYDLDGWLWKQAQVDFSGGALLKRMESSLGVVADGWSVALARVSGKPGSSARRMLGRSRIHDMLVNVFLPFLHAKSQLEADERLAALAEEAYLLIPKLQGNRLLVEAAHRLFVPPSRLAEVVKKACDQQGVLQIYQDFCLPLGTVCKNCPLASATPVAEHLGR